MDWQLRVVGNPADRPYLKRLQHLIHRYKLESRIHFTGCLPELDLTREYREADVFVFPSTYEGYGISLAEALRAGLAFVAFSSGALPEVVPSSKLLIRRGDNEAFRQRLRRLIADPGFRRESGRNALLLSRRLPSWEDTGRCVLKAIRKGVKG